MTVEEQERDRALAVLKGVRVKHLLEDEEVQAAFKRLREKYTAAWKAARDVAGREAAWAMQHALDELENELTIVKDAGTRASLEQERVERVRAAQPKPRPR